MYMKVEEVIKPFDREARKRWSRLLKRFVGETVLHDYFGKSPVDNVSDWSYRVLVRVRRFIVEGDWLEKPLERLLDEIVND